MEKGKNKKNGGVPSRMGKKFYDAIEKIKDLRLRSGKSHDRVSTEKITNLIARHKNWAEMAAHIAEAPEEEVNQYGL